MGLGAQGESLCEGVFAQEQQAFHVVDEIGQADFRRRPGDPDRADEQVHPVLLLGKDMLDLAADSDLGAFARPIAPGTGWPFGFLRWMRLTRPFFMRNASLAAER